MFVLISRSIQVTIKANEHICLKFVKNVNTAFLFQILVQEGQKLITVFISTDIGRTKMRFKLVKLRNFCHFHSDLERQFFDSRRNPSKCLKNVKFPIVR